MNHREDRKTHGRAERKRKGESERETERERKRERERERESKRHNDRLVCYSNKLVSEREMERSGWHRYRAIKREGQDRERDK